ncbi:ABC transporter substrate-binding protein [Cucumibacter marinus]|uniref:ABC transporter substrate-binding protein n=1 Tax=Cucumibacter marinus TaxID=1121252 RepID=UPI00138AE5F0|nr:ABC transporter substrate-binding protein [Cucumibacter marinus]
MISTSSRRSVAPLRTACALVTALACATLPGTAAMAQQSGGTLELVGAGDVASFDPASARSAALFLHRGLTRTLLAFPTSDDPAIAGTPVADLAESVPVAEEGGKVYRFKIREGAMWGTDPARQITAADAVRGFERLCNPVRGTYAPSYYIGIIEGFEAFCDGFRQVEPTAEAMKAYMDENDASGLVAEDELTLRITLETPTPDFLSIVALPSSAPMAEEMLDYLPDSPDFRRNYVSSGPYQVADYVLNEYVHLERNPAWDPASDPLRKGYVDAIEVAFGTPDAGKTQRMIESADIDGYFDLSIATADLTRIMANPDDPQLKQFTDGAVNPALIINIKSPNNDGALANPLVRKAINYAANKAAVVQVGGGPNVKIPAHQILSPLVDGFEEFNLYPTPDNAGDPEKARALLAEAGYPQGIDLKFSYSAGGRYELYAAALQADMAKAGINLIMQPAPSRTVYSQMYQNPRAVENGAWDLGMRSISPDWIGNSARTMIVPLFDGSACETSATNWTCYNNPEVNALIQTALTAESGDVAAEAWRKADRLIMEDAPIVPLISGKISLYVSERLRNTTINLLFNNVDPTLVWIEE